MKKTMHILTIIVTILTATAAFAANTPAIRLEAPANAKAGETITVNVVAEITPFDEMSGFETTLKWNAKQLQAVSEPELCDRSLDSKLALKYDNAKGMTEIAAAAMTQSLKVTKQCKVTLAKQNFKIADTCKAGDAVKIAFSTDPKVTACGTGYTQQGKQEKFEIITGAVIVVK